MKTGLKTFLHAKVDPLLFAFICLILLLLGITATALTNQVSAVYDPTIAWLALPAHIQ